MIPDVNPIVYRVDNTGANGKGWMDDGTTHDIAGATDVIATPWDAQRARVHDADGVAPALQSGAKTSGNIIPAVAWHENKGGSFTPSDHAKALRSGASHSYHGVGVRRLTPTECERLQGFPDGWTAGQSDSARYRQLGNAVCVNVIEWIGKQLIQQLEKGNT